MRIIYSSALVLLITALVIFSVQNLATVAVSFLGWGISIPLPLLVLVVYLFGMVSGWSVFGFVRRSLQSATHKPEKTSV